MLMVIPISKMLSSIFMKLIARVGTIDEEKYAMMGLGTIMTVAAVAGRMGKGGAALRRSMSGGKNKGSDESGGTGSSGDGSGGGDSGGGGSGSATTDFLGGGEKATSAKRTEPTPLDNIADRAGEKANRMGSYGAYAGAFSPVAGPAVAGMMNLATKAVAGPVVAGSQVISGMRKGFKEHRSEGASYKNALSQSAMTLTGASSTSEASAKILGGVLGSALGSGGAKAGSHILGKPVQLANSGSQWLRNKVNPR